VHVGTWKPSARIACLHTTPPNRVLLPWRRRRPQNIEYGVQCEALAAARRVAPRRPTCARSRHARWSSAPSCSEDPLQERTEPVVACALGAATRTPLQEPVTFYLIASPIGLIRLGSDFYRLCINDCFVSCHSDFVLPMMWTRLFCEVVAWPNPDSSVQ
jgi:hypothetical protein